MEETIDHQAARQSLMSAIAAIRSGDLKDDRVSRLSDLSRDDLRILAEAWRSIPEDIRQNLVRRCEEIAEERVEFNFSRALTLALEDPSPVVRQLAVSALWENESQILLDRLRKLFAEDESPDVRASVAGALERYASLAASGALASNDGDELRSMLLNSFTDPQQPLAVRRRSLEALGPLGGHPDVAQAITEAYESGEHGLQCSAIYAMGKTLDARWLESVLAELEGDDAELRYEAARAAGSLGSTDALPALLDAAADEDPEVRHTAIAAIGRIGGRGAVRALERLSEDAGEADHELIDAAIEEASVLLEPIQDSR